MNSFGVLDIVDIVLFVAAVLACGASLGMLPSTWREYRWSRRHGDYDEVRIGRGMWWGAVAAAVACINFVVFGYRMVLVPSDELAEVQLAYLGVGLVLVSCVALLVSYASLVKRRTVVSPSVEETKKADDQEVAGPQSLAG